MDGKFTKAIEEKNKIEAEISILKHKLESKSYNMAEIENQKMYRSNEKVKCEENIKEIEGQIFQTSEEIEEKKQKAEEFKNNLQRLEKDYSELSGRYNSETKKVK